MGSVGAPLARRARRVALPLLAAALVLLAWPALMPPMQVAAGAAIIAYLLSPLCRLLEGRLPRGAASFCAVALAALCAAGAVVLVLPRLIAQVNALMGALTRFARGALALYADVRARAAAWGLSLPEAGEMASGLKDFAPLTISAAGGLAQGAYRLSLSAVLACFLLADRERLLLRLEMLVPLRWRGRAVAAGGAVRRELGVYLRGQAMISLAVGALAAVGLWLIGVPAAPALGVIVGALNLIPYFGPILGGVPAVIMAMQDGLRPALMAAAVLTVVQQMDGMLISPRIMGSLTGFSPAAVLLAVFFGSTLAGVAGMLLALPVLMAARTLFRVFVQNSENI